MLFFVLVELPSPIVVVLLDLWLYLLSNWIFASFLAGSQYCGKNALGDCSKINVLGSKELKINEKL